MKILLVASCLTLAVLPMCKPDPATTNSATVDPASPSEARAQFDILRDSADASWARMMRSDDQMLADLRGLLRDLGQQPALSKITVDSLRQATDQLPGLRYDRQTMAESARIDRYDDAQLAVLHRALPLAAPHDNAPTDAVRGYVERINQADEKVLTYRVAYDHAAKAYNDYLQTHHEVLAQAGRQYVGLQPLPLFTLPK